MHSENSKIISLKGSKCTCFVSPPVCVWTLGTTRQGITDGWMISILTQCLRKSNHMGTIPLLTPRIPGHDKCDKNQYQGQTLCFTQIYQVEKQWDQDVNMLGNKWTFPVYKKAFKRCLLLGRKAVTNLDSILKSRDITLLTKVQIVKAMIFPVIMNRCESWTIKKAEHWRIDAFKLWC